MGSSARDLVLFSSRSLGTIADTPATLYMRPAPNILPTAPGRYARCLTCALILLFSVQAGGQSADKTKILQQLTEERLMLMAELDQFQNTLRILQSDDTPPEESTNPAIRSLAVQVVKLKEQLIAVTEQEVTLLQQQIIAAKLKTDTNRVQKIDTTVALAKIETRPDDSIEGKPLRTYNVDYAREREAKNVERLHALLENYYTELQESARVLPTAGELANREIAQRAAESLTRIPFNIDKIRLNGAEGSTSLLLITQRLTDSRIPESRRDIAPIITIKTRLFDTLVGSESRSLKPVGKNHYIAKIRLQPGDTSIGIQSHHWQIRLPSHANAQDFLITLYSPLDAPPELHIFAVDELLAQDAPHIPAWLPADLDLKTQQG